MPNTNLISLVLAKLVASTKRGLFLAGKYCWDLISMFPLRVISLCLMYSSTLGKLVLKVFDELLEETS